VIGGMAHVFGKGRRSIAYVASCAAILVVLLVIWSRNEGAGGATGDPATPDGGHAGSVAADNQTGTSPPIPAAMEPCAMCHGPIVEAYLGSGMARTIGPIGTITPGSVTNPISKNRYAITTDREGTWLTATFPDGGTRRQRIVGRIGAGTFSTSWIGAEYDPQSGSATGRLFFAPVETVTGRGLELAPFEHHADSPGLDLSLTEDCLTCHTTTEPGRLPRAAVATSAPDYRWPFPANHLGADAFDHFSPITCRDCHGDVERHPSIVMGEVSAPEGDIGLTRLGALPPGAQRDICARCHLQGDARIDLVGAAPRRDHPMAGQIPVLVARKEGRDFRFVGQVERLAFSACFKASPAMTCTTCHDPHSSVAAQGTASFDAACIACHHVEATHTSLTVPDVTGHPARTPAGCVDCHVRRSQPFDLPHLRTADHFIRRAIPLPDTDIPHRQFTDREGELMLYDDGRLAKSLATPDGKRWLSGVMGMGLVTLGRFEEAARHFDTFPPPGSPAARQGSAPPGLVPLETQPAFHTIRALILLSTGKIEGALAALGDAVTVDPLAAEPRMARARISLDIGDVKGALLDTQAVIQAYPLSEQPWDIRVDLAERTGRMDLALSALEASARLWPSNAITWFKIGMLRRERGDADAARQALERARTLRPSLEKSAAPPQ
jgi:hypothetical protein